MARALPTLERPEGFALAQNFLDEEEERELLAHLKSLDYRAVVMRGVVANSECSSAHGQFEKTDCRFDSRA